MKAPLLIAAVILRSISADPGRLEWDVEGKGFESDPRLPALRLAAGRAAEDALARLEAELGLRPGKAPIRWVLDASLPLAASKPEPFELGRTAFDARGVVVSLPARRHLRSPAGARPVIAHEAAHAALASVLGSRERYEAVPRWLREGIAIDVAGEGDAAVEDAIGWTVFQGRPADSFLVGLAAPDVSPAEAYLGVKRLVERVGGAGLRALVTEVAKGRSLSGLLEAFAGLSEEAFAAAALVASRERARRLLPIERERTFRESLRLDGERAAALRQALLRADPAGPLASTLRYQIAKGRLGSGAGEGERRRAREDLEALLASRSALWRPEAFVLLGECLEAEGRTDAAREAWLEVQEVFGEDPGPAERARRHLEASAAHRGPSR